MGKEEQCRVYTLLQVIEKLPRLLEASYGDDKSGGPPSLITQKSSRPITNISRLSFSTLCFESLL